MSGKLVEGSVVPNFQLQNQAEQKIDFYEFLNSTKKGVIIFVYPKADTPGCTTQACGFRDKLQTIEDHGYRVLGMSKDKAPKQAQWKSKYKLPFDLLCEADSILTELGSLIGTRLTRSVFVVDKASKKLILHRVKISPGESIKVTSDLIGICGENARADGESQEPKIEKKATDGKKSSRGRPPKERGTVASSASSSSSETLHREEPPIKTSKTGKVGMSSGSKTDSDSKEGAKRGRGRPAGAKQIPETKRKGTEKENETNLKRQKKESSSTAPNAKVKRSALKSVSKGQENNEDVKAEGVQPKRAASVTTKRK